MSSLTILSAEDKKITERMEKAALDILGFDPFSLKGETVDLIIPGQKVDLEKISWY